MFPKGVTIEIGLQLSKGDSRLMDIAGRIVRAMPPSEPDSPFAMSYGVEFSDIQAVDQNEIVQWIFSNQREQIRRRRELKP
jgi:c-di-GMP-binding flagellar brake protein YcgR